MAKEIPNNCENIGYCTPALWRIPCLRGKVLFKVIRSIKRGGFVRLQSAILGNGFGVGHSALLVSIIP